jgi:hypothetical protein
MYWASFVFHLTQVVMYWASFVFDLSQVVLLEPRIEEARCIKRPKLAEMLLTRFPLRLPSPVAAAVPTTAFLLPALTRVPLLRRTQPRSNMSAAAADAATDSAASNPGGGGEGGAKDAVDVLVQYVVLRRDLADAWPTGSVVAQGCHAAVAAVWEHRDHPDTAAYCAPDNLDRMHKACSTVCVTPNSSVLLAHLTCVDRCP